MYNCDNHKFSLYYRLHVRRILFTYGSCHTYLGRPRSGLSTELHVQGAAKINVSKVFSVNRLEFQIEILPT